MRRCVECEQDLPDSEFYRNGQHVRKKCKACYNSYRGKGSCDDCGQPVGYRTKRCRDCDSESRFGTAEWRISDQGYVVKLLRRKGQPARELRQHRVVMEAHIGRPLLSSEHVHHINGVRHDNRLENLELWTTSHPSGQRVEDVVQWCKETLALYSDLKQGR
jgi:hypothetical protein